MMIAQKPHMGTRRRIKKSSSKASHLISVFLAIATMDEGFRAPIR